MKIVHTFWTGPKTTYEKAIFNNGGWMQREYHYMSWALSCLQFRKFYNQVELITNKAGKEILIDRLKLPYTNVEVVLDVLDEYPAELWALAKIYTYSLQKEPFIHADGDVYIWEELDRTKVYAPLVAQNLEINFKIYYDITLNIEKNFIYIPESIRKERASTDVITSCNAGIFGGTDIDFFKKYTQAAFAFIDNNIQYMQKISMPTFNISFEQYLFYCMAKSSNVPISYLIDVAIIDSTYKGFANFDKIPKQTKFIHALGEFKRHRETCQHLAKRLRLDYPEYYYRILDTCQQVTDIPTQLNLPKTCIQKITLESHFKYKQHYFNKDFNFFKSFDYSIAESIKNRKIDEVFNLTLTTIYHILPDRTQQISGNNYPEADNFINQVQSLLQNMPESISRNVLSDVFNYELAKANFIKQVKSDTFLYIKDVVNYEQAEQLFNRNDNDLMEQMIQLDEDVHIISSEWNWRINFNTDPSLLVKDNLCKPAQFYQTLLIPNIESLSVEEYNLDSLNIVLLDAFIESKPIKQAIQEVSLYFDAQEIETSFDMLKNLVIERIRELFFLGTLAWIKKLNILP